MHVRAYTNSCVTSVKVKITMVEMTQVLKISSMAALA
jgi:hypothetical protein